MKQLRLFPIGLLVAFAAGCAATSVPDPDRTEGGADASGGSAGSSGYEGDQGFGGEDVPYDRADQAMGMLIYFDFDQSDLKPEYADLLSRHADRLSNNPRTRVRLEGHADERGSREYNIGLGERRSQAVRRMLLIQGATAGQISTVSFGEERPAAFGSDEESYALNRRVEIKYLN
ncbi:MAG: peptidoglycan-associated lipoprotein Pal [Woeseia sp.]